jgi:hypothetical protein
VAVATSAVPAAGAPSYTDIVLDTAKRTFDPLGVTAPFIKGAVGSVGTAYENVLGTAQAGAKLKENADVAFNRVLYGEPEGDTHAVSKAIGRAKDWSPLNAEQQAAYDKFKQRTPLKDVTLSTLPATAAQLVGEQVPQYGLTIAGTLLGGPVGGVLMSGLTQVGARYNENLKKGVDTPGSSFFVGGLQSALDALGPWLAVKGITKGLLSTAGAEGGTELVQEILAILHEKFYDIPQGDVFWRLMENFLAGLFLGGAAHVALHPGEAPTPPPAAAPPLPPGVTEIPPAPVVPRMAGTNAPAFQGAPPPPTGPFASRVPTPTAPRAGPPLVATPRLEGTNAPQFQGAPPTPTGPFASRVPTPTQPPIQGLAVRPPYEPVPAEGVVQKDIRTPVPFPARESAEAFGLMGPRQTPPAGPMSPAEQSAQILMRANQGARRATVTPQESRLGDPAAELLGEAREEVSRLLSTPRDPVHPNDPIVHEHLWEWLGSEDPRAVVIREQLIEVWPRRSAPGPDPVPSRTDLLVWAKEVEKSQQQAAPPPAPPVESEPAVVPQAPPQPLIPPPPQQAPPPPALSLGPQWLSSAPQPGAAPTATAAAIAPPPAVAPFRQQVTMPGTPAPPTPTAPPAGDMVIQTPEGMRTVDSAEVLADKVLTAAGEAPVEKPAAPSGLLDKLDAAGKAADERLRARLQAGKLRSPNPLELAQWVGDMSISIAGDVARGVIHAKNFVQEIVNRFGEQARPVALQVYREAQKLAAQGTPSAAPPVSPGASAAAPASVTATQPTGSPQGQPAQVSVEPPPLPPPVDPTQFGDAQDPEATTRQRLEWATRSFGWVKRRGLQLFQAAQLYPDFQPIQDQIAAQARRDAAITQWQNKGGKVYQAIVGLGKARTKTFFQFAFDVRLWEIKMERALTDQELAQLAQSKGVDEKSFTVYQQMQAYFRESLEGLRVAQIRKLQSTIEDPIALGKAIAKTNEQFNEQAERHFFPLKRFGNYMVSAYIPTSDPRYKKGTKIDQQAHFETAKAARQAKAQIEAEYRADGQIANVVVSEKLSPEIQNLASLPPDMAARLADELKLDADQRAELGKMVGDRITDNSFLQHLKRAKGTAGFSTDGLRSLAAYAQSHARHMGDTQESHNLQQAVRDAKEAIENLGRDVGNITGTDIIRIQQLLKVMQEANVGMLNPKVRGLAAAGGVNAWYFIFNPKQVLVNLTQSMITAPILSQQEILSKQETPSGTVEITKTVGTAEATKQVLLAMKDVGRAYTTRVYQKVKNKATGAPDQYVYTGKIKPHEWEAMERAKSEGILGDTQAANMASHARSSLAERMGGEAVGLKGEAAGRGFDEAFQKLTEAGLTAHQMSEEYNRQVAFLSSFRALEAAGHPDPYTGAVKVVKLSQGYNAASNKSWAQRTFPNAMMFKSYTMNNAYLQTMTKYGRRLWLAHLVMSGLQGAMGAEHIFKFIDWLGSWAKKFFGFKDPHVDIKHDIREFSTRVLGQIPTELLLEGISGGMPIPGFPDVSGSVGQGRVLPFVDPAMDLAHGTVDYKTFLEREVRDLFGVGASTGLDTMKTLVEDSPDSLRFWKAFTPKFLGQLLEAQNAYEEGGVKDAQGNMVLKMDPANPRDLLEMVGMAAGLPSKRVTLAKEGNWAAKEHQRYYQKLLDNLQRDYNTAHDSGDEDAIAKVHAEIEKMNDTVLPEGIHRYLGQFQRNYLTRERNQQRVEEGNIGPRQWWDESQKRRAVYGVPAPAQ